MVKINFWGIENFILFGGGKFLLHVAKKLKADGFEVVVFSAPRHLNEDIDGKSLRALLDENTVIYHESEDINKDALVSDYISDKTFSLSFGAAWIFKRDFIDKFHGKLINFHGTRLPQNRGAGGFTWQILRQNKLGFCLMHQVDYGVDTGDIIKYREFLYPHFCKMPADFMEYHIKENISFFEEFLNEIRSGKDFECISQPEYISIYWPRLNTLKQAFIDWSWSLEDIENFINAFDEPYAGASTFINNRRVFLKSCCSDYNDGTFHPFQNGMVYRKNSRALSIATKEGTLIIEKVMDENNKNIINDIRVGDRFFTPTSYLEDAKLFRATYTPSGLKEG
jgi:methionyl-tRNA formyltransferase